MGESERHVTALVTGACGGIGRELAARLAHGGCDLVLVGREVGRLEALAAELRAAKAGARIQTLACDLARPEAVGTLVERLDGRGLHIDVLVNNAGFGYDAPFASSDADRQRALVRVDVEAVVELTHALVPAMVARGRGAVLNVASIAGFMPGPAMATYYASKAFVQSVTQALHAELAGSGVHVTALCPGPVATPFWDNAGAGQTWLARLATPAAPVARAALSALEANRALCVPGILAKAVVFASRLLPRSAIARMARALQ